eukprot:273674-Amphidinium_carterae.1
MSSVSCSLLQATHAVCVCVVFLAKHEAAERPIGNPPQAKTNRRNRCFKRWVANYKAKLNDMSV